ncbi:unnamed protein product [Ascophyllum nodosum]
MTHVAKEGNRRKGDMTRAERDQSVLDVASWWRKNAGNILEESRGADDRDKQMLEKVIDANIPEELLSIMSIQDGQLWFSEKQALTCRAMVAAALEFEQRSRGWRHGLIPFAKDANGNFLVADTNARGCPVEEWNAEGEVSAVSKTFSLFLECYRNDLLSGRCEYVDGIGIIEKVDNASTRRGK